MARTRDVEGSDAADEVAVVEDDDAITETDDVEPELDEVNVEEAEVDEVNEVDIDVSDDDEDDDLEEGAALDELEAEELQMLTDDEAAETIVVDEAAEMRALRRAELALDVDPEEVSADEFVCQSCFLVKRTSQLADKRKKICADCAS